jgi:hypothetical protein
MTTRLWALGFVILSSFVIRSPRRSLVEAGASSFPQATALPTNGVLAAVAIAPTGLRYQL